MRRDDLVIATKVRGRMGEGPNQIGLSRKLIMQQAIKGAKKMDQLKDNKKAVDVKFSEAELQKLDEISKLSPEYPGWMVDFQSGDRKF